MKKLLWLLLVISILVPHAVAQNGQVIYASDFSQWQLPQGTGAAAGAINYPSPEICRVSSQARNFVGPKVGRPLKIIDTVIPSQTEYSTPTQVTLNNNTCNITLPTQYTHYNYFVLSGTAGLQEAIDYIAQSGNSGSGVVVLTPAWNLAGGLSSMITAASGNANVSIIDERTSCFVSYAWNGANYAFQANFCSNGGTGVPAGPSFALNFANNGATAFQGDQFIRANPTTHTISAFNISYHTPSDYGAQANGTYVYDAVMNSGSCVVNSPSGGFAGALPGMLMFVVGAGSSSWDGPAPAFAQTIASVQSSHQVTMNQDSSAHCAYQDVGTPTNGKWDAVFGTDDSVAVQACVTNGTMKGGRCTIPQGQTITYGSSLQFLSGTAALTPGGVLDGAGTLVFVPIGPLTFPTTDTGMWMDATQRTSCQQITGGPEVYSLTVATSGSGQTPGTYSVSASGGGGTGATISVIVSLAGTVTATPIVTNPGSGYTSAPTFTLSAGGTPATFNVTMGYVPTPGNPITSVTVASSGEYAGMQAGDPFLIGMQPIAGVVEQFDWAQFASGTGTTVTLMHPLRMAFSNPVAYNSSCQGLWFFGLVQNSVPTSITMRDFTMIVPNVQDGSGNHVTAIDVQFTRNLIRDNITVMNAGERNFAANFDQHDIAINSHFNEAYRSEYTNSVDDVIVNDSWDNTPSSITGGLSYGTNPGANANSGGPSVSYGAGFYTLSGIKIHNPTGPAAIAAYSGLHDSSISDISIDYNTSTHNPTAGMLVTGGYNNRFSRMSLNGAAATAGSVGLLLQNDLENGVCFPTYNNLYDKVDAPGFLASVSLGQCNGSVTTTVGTDIDLTNGALRFSSPIETSQYASLGSTMTPSISPLLLFGSPSGGMELCMAGIATANDCWGTQYSSGAVFTSYNAGQPTLSVDQWIQYESTAGSTLLTHDYLDGLNLYTTPPGQAPAVFSSFFTKQFEVTNSGIIAGKNLTLFPGGVAGLGANFSFNLSSVAGAVHLVIPNADSNPVQPLSAPPTGGVVGWIDVNGVQQPVNGPITAPGFIAGGIPKFGVNTPVNNDITGNVALSSGSGSYSFAGTYVNAPNCVCSEQSALNAVKCSATNTTLTLTGTGSDVITYICVNRQ